MNISRHRLILSLIIILIISIFLAGCVRPIPEGEATAVAAEPDISDPNVGGGTSIDPTEAPQISPTETVPEAEIESTPESGYPASEENVAEGDVVTQSEEATTADEVAATEPAPAAEAPESADQTTANQPTTTESEQVAATAECPKEHVVQPGENLFRIGLQYGLSWVTLAQYNGITNPNNIVVGQTIKIPCDGTTPPVNPTTPPVNPTPSPDNVTTYIVQPGDNLFQIGLKFGVSWVEVAEANGIVNPNEIYAGQVLKIPTSAPGPRPEFTHIVKSGETVYSISAQYDVPAAAIAEANNLQEPYVIYAGQTLIIPGNG